MKKKVYIGKCNEVQIKKRYKDDCIDKTRKFPKPLRINEKMTALRELIRNEVIRDGIGWKEVIIRYEKQTFR